MERLTYRAELGVSIDKNEDCPTCSICWNCDIKAKDCRYFNDAVEKLANYEDAEEQGLILKLPCKMNDEAWAIRNYKGVTYAQKGFVNEMFFTKDMRLVIVVKNIARGEFGKTVFLTK